MKVQLHTFLTATQDERH